MLKAALKNLKFYLFNGKKEQIEKYLQQNVELCNRNRFERKMLKREYIIRKNTQK